MKIYYFDLNHAISTHDIIIAESGGLPGTKDEGRLESVLDHLKNDIYYPNFERKLSRLVFALIKFHMFNDGNKRSSISLGAFFLNINGYIDRSDVFIDEMENIVLWVAQGLIEEDFLTDIISSIILYNKLTETIKLRLTMLLINIE